MRCTSYGPRNLPIGWADEWGKMRIDGQRRLLGLRLKERSRSKLEPGGFWDWMGFLCHPTSSTRVCVWNERGTGDWFGAGFINLNYSECQE